MIHLDTSFLVDLLRESSRKQPAAATRFLEANLDQDLWISVFVACELAAGAESSRRPSQERDKVGRLCSSLNVAYPDRAFPDVYGRLLAGLARVGQRISAMDLLIATAAIRDDAPLVTGNVRDFKRVGGLEVLTY